MLLAEEAGHEWIAPEILKRYATDAESQQKCLEALKKRLRAIWPGDSELQSEHAGLRMVWLLESLE